MTVLIVGSGFTGTALGRCLTARRLPVVLASRTPPTIPAESYGATWTPLDATDTRSCARTMAELRPTHVVLVHGPSDVTWCESHATRAAELHSCAAGNIAAAAPDARLLLVSTDNVFDGRSADNSETSSPSPANAYGRAKLRAERILQDRHRHVLVLRVSLIYGYEPATSSKWLNFFAASAHLLSRGSPVQAPHDQWTTPVHVDDVAAVATALLAAREPPPPLLHLGGPDRLSRAEWAAVIAEELGACPSLVVPVSRNTGRYATRPANSCLVSKVLPTVAALRDIRLRGVREAARDLAFRFRP